MSIGLNRLLGTTFSIDIEPPTLRVLPELIQIGLRQPKMLLNVLTLNFLSFVRRAVRAIYWAVTKLDK
ncbi:hypothetical protein DWG20_05675 [Crenobacter cavernae]|uniref:Uncharacterized protein n=1 Tax=Crenobacter cavernae TaxID=2290923 RepID=A0A345Y4W1_9NEIS|nr:hypothetical protein DWG20_05675 [Crenobacter cavernae]